MTTRDRLIGIRRGNRPLAAPEFDLRLFFIAGIVAVITLTWPLVRAADAPPAGSGAAYSEKIPGSTVSIDMVPTPAGEFKVEGKDPVKIKALYVSTTEIPWDAYDIFCFQLDMTDKEKAAGVDAKSRPSRPYGDQTHGFGHAHYPAIHITRFAAEGFCLWLSKKTGHTYRLPAEAEWTYLCRAGGDGHADDLDKVAWFADNSDSKAHPVGKKQPNGWGLYDMLGNVAEYVEIPGEPKDAKPTACGGSYDDDAKDVTCNARKVQTPDWNSTDPQNPKSKWWLSDGPFVGFRIVREQ
jgi:formylglycine-generating enzyme required for sulfatase activity